jgi:cholesterol transport system auxiliary component
VTLQRRSFLALPALACLAGCGAFSAASTASDPLDTYTLTPLPSLGQGQGGRGHIVVELPTAGGALTTDRILIRPTTLQAQYLSDGRWSDPAPALVQTLLIGSLLNRSSFRLISRVGAGLMPDYTVMTEIQAMEAELVSPDVDSDAVAGTQAVAAQVQITLQMTLIRESDRTIHSTRRIAATVLATSDSTLAIVAGFDAAMQVVLAEAVAWLTANT